MLSRRAILKATLGLCSCGGCATAEPSTLATSAGAEPKHIPGRGYDIRFVGTQRDTIANGKIAALIDLRTLATTPHLYAIGPIEQLRGEVTIIDGRPSLSRVGPNRSILVSESFETGAPFLVWAEVPAWRTIPIPPEVRSFTDLEAFTPRAAATVGLDSQQPVPLLVHGQEDLIEFHILNRVGDELYSPAKIKEIQLPFDLAHVDATIVGFYSPSHRGIFTPMDSSMHIHFQTAKNDASGHIHALEIGAGAVLSLPQAG
jgi:acetolactate decarboxylase